MRDRTNFNGGCLATTTYLLQQLDFSTGKNNTIKMIENKNMGREGNVKSFPSFTGNELSQPENGDFMSHM